MESYEEFINQRENIQHKWLKYVKSIDHKIQSALVNCVKNTICDLKKHIIGEKQKADNSVVFVPIFRVYTNIDSSNPNKI